MTVQPTLFGFPISRTRQAELFDGCAVPTGRHCPDCGRELVPTESGFVCCPRGHGKLVPDRSPDDDESVPPRTWPVEARRIAKRHARRDNWLGRRWRCGCGACEQARRDGFIPRERIDR